MERPSSVDNETRGMSSAEGISEGAGEEARSGSGGGPVAVDDMDARDIDPRPPEPDPIVLLLNLEGKVGFQDAALSRLPDDIVLVLIIL